MRYCRRPYVDEKIWNFSMFSYNGLANHFNSTSALAVPARSCRAVIVTLPPCGARTSPIHLYSATEKRALLCQMFHQSLPQANDRQHRGPRQRFGECARIANIQSLYLGL